MKKILISVLTLVVASSVFASNAYQSIHFPDTISYQTQSLTVPEGRTQIISGRISHLQELSVHDGAVLRFTNKHRHYMFTVNNLVAGGAVTIYVPKNVQVTFQYQNISPGAQILGAGQGTLSVVDLARGY